MGIVADEVAGVSVHRTEEEGDVVFVDGIMAKVEVFDFNNFGEKGQMAQEGEDGVGVDAAIPEFDGVFRCDVLGNEECELALEPEVDDFPVGTGRGLGFSGGDGDVGVEDAADNGRVIFWWSFAISERAADSSKPEAFRFLASAKAWSTSWRMSFP